MRGLLWMAADVITFVITSPGYGQCLETIKFAIFYRLFQGSNWTQRRITTERNSGSRSDELMTEITKQDVVAFRSSLIAQVSAKTANHDLKALKMLFKSARREGVVTEDPTEFVETVRRERVEKAKGPFTLQELRSVLDLASDGWRSMILFGLYSGPRLGDIATLRWKNIDLAHRELRFSTRKTGRTMILPLAEPLRKYIESLPIPVDLSAPVHPQAFGLLAGEVIVSESGEFSPRERSEIASRLGIHWEEELIFSLYPIGDNESLLGLTGGRSTGLLPTAKGPPT